MPQVFPHSAPHTLAPPLLSSLVFRVTLPGLLLVIGWDLSGMDLPMARLFGDVHGFAYTNHWFWGGVLHDHIRLLPWIPLLALLLAVGRPFGWLRQLPIERRAQLAFTPLIAVIVISGLKLHSGTSCPWDLQEFGGMARHVSHWAWGITDGGHGGCFPAGHASGGFAFIGGFFALRHTMPVAARRWLWAALVAGLVLGLAQQVRGAHYMSHTLWTAWLCWTAAAVMDRVFSEWISQTPTPAPVQVPDLSALQPWTQ